MINYTSPFTLLVELVLPIIDTIVVNLKRF